MAHNGAPATSGLLHRQLDMPSRVDEITDRLITAIAIGEYLPGARLPVERDLAASLGAGRMTVRAALARLVERGLLETPPRSWWWIVCPGPVAGVVHRRSGPNAAGATR